MVAPEATAITLAIRAKEPGISFDSDATAIRIPAQMLRRLTATITVPGAAGTAVRSFRLTIAGQAALSEAVTPNAGSFSIQALTSPAPVSAVPSAGSIEVIA